jgi:hypothetical protein
LHAKQEEKAMYMIMFVLDDNSCLNRILKSWSDLGISGATIAETSGLHRQQVKHIPMRYTYGDSPTDEIGNTTMAAIKIGANDMAVGNLFGSNMFNMFAIGLNDVFFTQGRFLEVIDPSFLLVGAMGILMTGMGLIGNLAKFEKRIWFFEIDALALIIVFFGSLWLIYIRS